MLGKRFSLVSPWYTDTLALMRIRPNTLILWYSDTLATRRIHPPGHFWICTFLCFCALLSLATLIGRTLFSIASNILKTLGRKVSWWWMMVVQLVDDDLTDNWSLLLGPLCPIVIWFIPLPCSLTFRELHFDLWWYFSVDILCVHSALCSNVSMLYTFVSRAQVQKS